VPTAQRQAAQIRELDAQGVPRARDRSSPRCWAYQRLSCARSSCGLTFVGPPRVHRAVLERLPYNRASGVRWRVAKALPVSPLDCGKNAVGPRVVTQHFDCRNISLLDRARRA
jgi:hypothetical protein